MAGANNAQMKAAGWRAADVQKARAEYGKVSHDTMVRMGASPKKGADPGGRRAAKAESTARNVRDLGATMMANRKAAAAKTAAPAKSGPAERRTPNADRISSLRNLPTKRTIPMKATESVLRDYVNAPVYARSRRGRLADLNSALDKAVRDAPRGTTSLRFTVRSTGAGGPQGIGESRDFNFKARLLKKDGKPQAIAVNLVSMKRSGESSARLGDIRRGAMASNAAKARELTLQGSGRVRSAMDGDGNVYTRFKHRGKDVVAVSQQGPNVGRVQRVVDASGAPVRDRGAIRRAAVVTRAAAARTSALRAGNVSPAVARRQANVAQANAAREATAAAAAREAAKRKGPLRIQPQVSTGTARSAPYANVPFTHKGKAYEVRHRALAGTGMMVTNVHTSGGGYVQRPSKGLKARAERIIRAVQKRHQSGGKGIEYR